MLTRRDLLELAPMALPGRVYPRLARLLNDFQPSLEGDVMDWPEHYPASSADLIRTVVTVAHFDLSKLRDLVDPHPELAKASWDWGFGDWETPLGAACHMGRRDIAGYLLSKGATPSLFSWVLFGDLAMVRQIVEGQPGIERVGGPHSISLLAHARMGGAQSKAVLDYVTSLRDADSEKPMALTDEETASICGAYRFGASPTQRIDVSGDMSAYRNTPMYTYAPQLNWMRQGTMARPLFHTGSRVFHPAGAPSVEIRFERQGGAMVMAVRDGEMVLTAPREEKA